MGITNPFLLAAALLALQDVATWLGYEAALDYNAACRKTPEVVRAQLKAAR